MRFQILFLRHILAPIHLTGRWQPPALHLYRHMINHFDSS